MQFSGIPLNSLPTQPNVKKTPQIKARVSVKNRARGNHLPCEDHDKIHHVPTVPEIRAFMKNKPQCDDFYTSFKTKYSNKVGLSVILKKNKNQRCQGGLCASANRARVINNYLHKLHMLLISLNRAETKRFKFAGTKHREDFHYYCSEGKLGFFTLESLFTFILVISPHTFHLHSVL